MLTCADGLEGLDQLTWSNWGSAEATATGYLLTSNCDPSCAEDKQVSYQVSVTAKDLVLGEAAASYRTLTIKAAGDTPTTLEALGDYDLSGPPALEPSGNPDATPDLSAFPTKR